MGNPPRTDISLRLRKAYVCRGCFGYVDGSASIVSSKAIDTEWGTIRAAEHRCSLCGATWSSVRTQRWSVKPGSLKQLLRLLVKIDLVCPGCHMAVKRSLIQKQFKGAWTRNWHTRCGEVWWTYHYKPPPGPG